MKLTAEVKEREQLESQVRELETEQADVVEKLSSLQQGNDPLKQQRQALQAELNEMRNQHEEDEQTKRQHVRPQLEHDFCNHACAVLMRNGTLCRLLCRLIAWRQVSTSGTALWRRYCTSEHPALKPPSRKHGKH